MDYFGRENLKELIEWSDGPAVSVYVETEPTSGGAETNRLRFRAALEEAEGRLGEELERERVSSILEPLKELLDAEEYWTYQAGGFAAFAAEEFTRKYRLPTRFVSQAVVAPTFHTRPLVEYLQAPDRFWVVGLSQKEVRIWEGSLNGLTPIDLSGVDVPKSLQDALGYEFERDDANFTRSRRKAAFSGGRSPVFHGHGVGQNDSEPELRRFFREVDRGVKELLEDEIGPVVVAAVDYYHPIYRSVSELDLTEEGIEGNVMDWSTERLHEEAWSRARTTVLEKIDRALELWENAYNRGKGETDLAGAAKLAAAGRVRLLLTEREQTVWGRLDRRTGQVERLQEGGDDPGPEAVDLLDEIPEIVMLHGGRSMVLPADRMPTDTGVAAILW